MPSANSGCSLVTSSLSRLPSGPSSVTWTMPGAVRRNRSVTGRNVFAPVKASREATRSPTAMSLIFFCPSIASTTVSPSKEKKELLASQPNSSLRLSPD